MTASTWILILIGVITFGGLGIDAFISGVSELDEERGDLAEKANKLSKRNSKRSDDDDIVDSAPRKYLGQKPYPSNSPASFVAEQQAGPQQVDLFPELPPLSEADTDKEEREHREMAYAVSPGFSLREFSGREERE